MRNVQNIGDRGLSIVGVTRVMAGVKVGQNVNAIRYVRIGGKAILYRDPVPSL